MKRSRRMTVVCNVFAARQREAAAKMVACEQRLDDARTRLVELQRFRSDYGRQLASGKSAEARRMAELAIFVARLDAAIAALQRQLHDLADQRDVARQAWFDSRREQSAVGSARDRFVAGELRDEERREQIESDECAAARRPAR